MYIRRKLKTCCAMHPGIVDCAVFGVPDNLWGETVVAAVVLRDTTIEEIQAHCRNHLAGFKCPREIVPVSEIPRNAAQKTVRKDLFTLWENANKQDMPVTSSHQ